MNDLPFAFTLPQPEVIPSRVDNHIQRRLSALRGQFLDQDTYESMLKIEDRLIYEVYEIQRPYSRLSRVFLVALLPPVQGPTDLTSDIGHLL